MGWDATERSIAFYQQRVWRRFCDRYGHAHVHALARTISQHAYDTTPLVLPENANGWLAEDVGPVGLEEPPYGSFFLDSPPEESDGEDASPPPPPSLSAPSFWRRYWESQGDQVASEPPQLAPEHAVPDLGGIPPPSTEGPVKMRPYSTLTDALGGTDALNSQISTSHAVTNGIGDATLDGAAPPAGVAGFGDHGGVVLSTSTGGTTFAHPAEASHVDWFHIGTVAKEALECPSGSRQPNQPLTANTTGNTRLAAAAGLHPLLPEHFHFEGASEEHIHNVDILSGPPSATRFSGSTDVTAFFSALGFEGAIGHFYAN